MKIMQAPSFSPAELEAKWQKMAENPMQRPAHLLKKDDDGKLHVDNVRWGFEETSADPKDWVPRFRDTVIDPTKVKDIYLGEEPFAPKYIGGHGYAVIELEQPIVNSQGEKDNRLVVSMEAWTPKGESYSAGKGMKPNFGVVFQLGSFGDRVQRITRKEGRSINLYKLDLSPQQKQEFTENALQAALKDRKGEWYNTMTNSCWGAQVILLNTVLPEKQQIHRWTKLFHKAKMSAVLPSVSGLVLQRKGVWNEARATEIVPDRRMWPAQNQTWVSRQSQKPWWGTAGRLTGAAAAGGLAYAGLGWAGAVLGGLAGYYSGGVVADHLQILEGGVKTQPDRFYPEFLKARLGIPAAAAVVPAPPPGSCPSANPPAPPVNR
ncbi:MAG: DUF4105 domain-containing protein [Vulcanimicrobiota bacterium]